MKIDVEIEGVSPLLMNRFNPEVKTSRSVKKTYVPKEEAEKSAYRTQDKKLFLPATHFKASMIKSAVEFPYKGKKTFKEFIKSGIFIVEPEIILDPQKYTIHEEPVVIQRARVMSWRPRFDKWSCKFVLEITDEEIIKMQNAKDILENAGKYKGVGDHRPEYGRFKIKSFKVVE